MLMGWGEKSNHRKSALDGLRVDVSLAVSPWQARAEVPPTSPVFSGQSPFHMVPKRHRQTDGFAVNNRFAEGQCAVCKGQSLPRMPSASCLISTSDPNRKWTRNSVRKSSDRAVAVNEQQLCRELTPTDY